MIEEISIRKDPLTGKKLASKKATAFDLSHVKIHVIGMPIFIHPVVFLSSVFLILATSILVLLYPDRSKDILVGFEGLVISHAGWWLILSAQAILLFVIYLAISRFGHIRLGGWDARPHYSNISWFAMMFSAGMGIGILFYGVVEPMEHYIHPLVPTVDNSMGQAMAKTFLHWGMHAWAIYALLGLALAFVSYNKGMPFSLRSILYPIFGKLAQGWLGDLVDILALLTTAFGVATSLGLGVSQMNAGFFYLGILEESKSARIWLIIVVTFIATLSASSGVQRGVKWLSNINIFVMVFLMGFVFFLGPTGHLASVFVQSTSQYYQNFLSMGGWTGAYQGDQKWLTSWTFFYWAWWISWAPFVGIFIAGISYGRTIREFIVGILLVPTLIIFLWFSIFGGYAQYIDHVLGDSSVREALAQNTSRPLFALLHHLPFFKLTAFLSVFSLIVFYVTSADSCALVMDTIAAGGRSYTPVFQRVLWSSLVGILALVFLLGHGLEAIKAGVITVGALFSVVLILIAVALWRSLSTAFPPHKMFHGVVEGEPEDASKSPLSS